MAMNFYAYVLNPNDKVAVVKVLRANTVAGSIRELHKKYLVSGGEATVYDGNPANPLHCAKALKTTFKK